MRKLGLSLSLVGFLVVSLAALDAYAACGVERWSIKTGTDAGAPAINLSTYISTTIYNMHSSAKPASLPANSRLSPRETNQYRLSGTLIKYVREGDSDYHLVIQDSAGRQMIVELPSINCVGAGSPFGTGISHARAQFDARFTATSTMKTTSTAVTLRGIGFWDFLHGQTGVAPNGIEVHPVLDISIGASAALAPGGPSTEGAGEVLDFGGPELTVQYPADVVFDDDGGRVHVYRGGEGVGEVFFHGGAVVENPSLQLVFVGDSWTDANQQAFLAEARSLSSDRRFVDMWRYGVRATGLRVGSRRVSAPRISAPRISATEREERSRDLRTPQVIAGPGSAMTDLDVQRLLADAVESGQIQHVDSGTVFVVVLEPNVDASVGATRDWFSYHSEFHPSELAMRYVVVRGEVDPAMRHEAMFASVARALVNPAGNGWF
jgi:hypothetical protein